jgi:ABC-type sulfate transport system permease component
VLLASLWVVVLVVVAGLAMGRGDSGLWHVWSSDDETYFVRIRVSSWSTLIAVVFAPPILFLAAWRLARSRRTR